MLELSRLSRAGWLAATLVAGVTLPSRIAAQVPAQGITVHGHWVIEVRNADGAVSSRTEFENALTTSGRATLAQLFGRDITIGFWRVFTESPASGLCDASRFCILDEPTSTSGGSTTRNLTETVVGSSVVLHGTFVALADGFISSVQTVLIQVGGGGGEFTRAALATPIAIQATQSVSVTVTFTFS